MSAVRPVTVSEVPRLVDLGVKFFAESKLPGKFNSQHFMNVWSQGIANGAGAVFISEQGGEFVAVIGGVTYKDPNTGDTMAAETFWFVREDFRGGTVAMRLMHAYEHWAMSKGAKVIFMTLLNHLTPVELRSVYERCGYREIETHFMKEVAWQQ